MINQQKVVVVMPAYNAEKTLRRTCAEIPHADYQYTPRLIAAMASLLAEGLFDCVLGSRILGVGARKGGMPVCKHVSNKLPTTERAVSVL
jgi:hypothetical protein